MMLKPRLNDKTALWFILIASLIFGLFLFVEINNGRFWLNDFKVMYMAAKSLVTNQPVYGVNFGLLTGFYKYSPVTLLVFVPFQVLPYQTAAILQYIVISGCSIASILLLRQIISQHFFDFNTQRLFPLVAVLLSIMLFLGRELHLGNTNMILLTLIILSIKLMLSKKLGWAGALIAFVVLTKPYFVVCFLPLLFYKQYKTILVGLLTGVGLVLFSFILFGFTKGVDLYTQWIQTLLFHSNEWYGCFDVLSLINRYAGTEIPVSASIYFFIGFSLILTTVLFLTFRKKAKAATEPSSGLIWMSMTIFFLVALAPSSLITDTEHFLFSLPILAMLIFMVSVHPKPVLILLAIVIVFLFEANSSDIIGKTLATKYDEYGVLGFVNLIIVGLGFWLFYAKPKLWKKEI